MVFVLDIVSQVFLNGGQGFTVASPVHYLEVHKPFRHKFVRTLEVLLLLEEPFAY